MNDRELLEFIAAQFGNLTTKVDIIDLKVNNIDERLLSVQNQLTTIESEHGKKLDALFDGYKQNTEAIKELSSKIDEVSVKIESHDVEISVIKRVK